MSNKPLFNPAKMVMPDMLWAIIHMGDETWTLTIREVVVEGEYLDLKFLGPLDSEVAKDLLGRNIDKCVVWRMKQDGVLRGEEEFKGPWKIDLPQAFRIDSPDMRFKKVKDE